MEGKGGKGERKEVDISKLRETSECLTKLTSLSNGIKTLELHP